MEAAVETAMCVLRAVFYAGQAGGFAAKGMQSPGMPEETEAGGAKAVAFEE
jgi:hypothetical protein